MKYEYIDTTAEYEVDSKVLIYPKEVALHPVKAHHTPVTVVCPEPPVLEPEYFRRFISRTRVNCIPKLLFLNQTKESRRLIADNLQFMS